MKISLIVHPNARKARIENDLLGTLHIYVHDKKSQIKLIHGAKSKNKIFEIN